MDKDKHPNWGGRRPGAGRKTADGIPRPHSRKVNFADDVWRILQAHRFNDYIHAAVREKFARDSQ